MDDAAAVMKLLTLIERLDAGEGMRDVEPALGEFVRLTPPTAGHALIRQLIQVAEGDPDPHRPSLRRGGYILMLTGYYQPGPWQWLLQNGDLTRSLRGLVPQDAPLIPFYAEGPLDRFDHDPLLWVWRLGSGTPYDRLQMMLRPPYVC